VRVRLVTLFFAAPLALATAFAQAEPALAVTSGPACGEQLVKNDRGVAIKILFAKNGSVQRYLVVDSQENMEEANDMRISLEQRYGPAGVDAPPMHIVSFKPGSGGMMVPDKAVDSCGRTLSFQ
jgi:hypothetical protein